MITQDVLDDFAKRLHAMYPSALSISVTPISETTMRGIARLPYPSTPAIVEETPGARS